MIKMSKVYPPEFGKKSFSCPFCGVFAGQSWNKIGTGKKSFTINDLVLVELPNYVSSQCFHCKEIALWVNERLVYPLFPVVKQVAPPPEIPNPNSDLNKHIRKIYNEARKIANVSPNGACALLRLALEMLCESLGAKGDNLEDKTLRGKIKFIVKEKGLDPELEHAFHIVRIVGNEVIHAGQTDLKDNKEIAIKLFDIINIIAEDLITKKKNIKKLYAEVTKPKEKKVTKKSKSKK